MKDTSGPAFPTLEWVQELAQMYPKGGLTHRQWLAGLAMAEMVFMEFSYDMTGLQIEEAQKKIVEWSHRLADAMLAYEQQEQGVREERWTIRLDIC